MATTTRKKKKVITDKVTRELAESSFADYAKAAARKKEMEGKMEQAIAKVREDYQDRLTKQDEEMEESFTVLEAYAMQNKEAFGDKKSIDFAHGTIGYRTGTPKLDKVKGFTWEAIASLLKDKGYNTYVRTKEEVDKETIINNRDSAEINKVLHECKMSIIQDETFFVKPKEETAAN